MRAQLQATELKAYVPAKDFSPMNVRRASPGDEPVLRALRLEALTDAPEAFGSTYAREHARTTADWQRWMVPGVTLIVEDAGVPRGLVAGVPDRDDSAVVHLMAMWVHPLLRSRGAADALVAALLRWALDRGAQRMQLMVISSNERAQRFYARQGFRLTGDQATRERDGAVEIQMERPLVLS
jgi:ribosomal protein S18 acetylase RimI-like enzyme